MNSDQGNRQNFKKLYWIFVGLLLLGGVTYLDHITGTELSFSIFYLIPISLFSWKTGQRSGYIAAFFSAGIWLWIEVISGVHYSGYFVYFWNGIIRLGFFLLPVYMFRLHEALEFEKNFSRTDSLTGVLNTRFFRELAQAEISRSIRYNHPFTLAFIDVDDFKSVNDTHGHGVGDNVLCLIAETLQKNLRTTDIVGRVGGDEFVVLLPEMDALTAPEAISLMRQRLLGEMQRNGFLVTFSIGVLSVSDGHLSIDEVLGLADKMMYVVKNDGKNNIHYAEYPLKRIEII
ncbi:MAG TPA: GGDEF domain-containing protein [Anaerolineales bacterium]|nr:GGDEF domain-containing protein [Anaerolineales bacterium]HNO32388.1 GGDEF domain-containing protein [Anaerolineales bacterium]